MRPRSPPDQFKFSKVQRLKLTVIQAALTPKVVNEENVSEDCNNNDRTTTTSDNTSLNANSVHKIPSNSSFDITDPQESFMATISTLIAALNLAIYDPEFNNPNLKELIKLFTAVFLKNVNIGGLVDVFEFQLDDGKVISEHLLTAYINFICVCPSEDILKSLLILLSSNLNVAENVQARYFHSFLTAKMSSDHLASLFDVLMEITCTFNYKSVGFIASVPIISDKSRLASQILVSLLLNQQSDTIFKILKGKDDLKSFALFIKFQSQIFQFSYPHHLNLNDLTIITILINSLINFCPNYRRFVLSKLDNEELVTLMVYNILFIMFLADQYL